MVAIENMQMRDAFISELFERAKVDRDIVFISNDFGAPSLDQFRAELPDQYLNAGISEQNIISVAAGMAIAGKQVFIYSIASFITLRCFEQIKLDICCQQLPVTILGVGACYAYAEDGPTHHATEDIAIMRTLAGMEIYSPSDSLTAQRLVEVVLDRQAPAYIRLDKGVYPSLAVGQDGLRLLGEEKGLCLVSTGIMVHRALEVAERLKVQGKRVAVLDMYRLKPLNMQRLLEILPHFERLVSIEEHTINGGLGSLLAELIIDYGLGIPLQRLAIADDELYCYGNRDSLHRTLGLDCDGLVQTILDKDKK